MATLEDAFTEQLFSEYERHEPSGYWSPSKLGFCDRKAVLEHAGVEKNPMDAETLRTYWMGNKIHEALQDTATKSLDVIGHELDFEGTIGDAKIRGRLDTYILNEGVREVVEFKSVKGSSWRYGGRPKREHLLQVGCYLMFAPMCKPEWHYQEGQENGVELFGEIHGRCRLCGGAWAQPSVVPIALPERARIVYFDKDNARMEEYVVQPSEQLFEAVRAEVTRLESLYQEYLTGKIPAGVVRQSGERKDPWQWDWCPYAGRGCCGDKSRG